MAQQRCWAPQNLPPQVVGTPKHTLRSPLLPTSAQSIGSEGSKLGEKRASLGPTEVTGTPKLAPTGGGYPKTYPSISITPYLPSVHWKQGERALVQQRWWARSDQHPGTSLGPQEASSLLPSLPEHLWVPGTFLGPQEALSSLSSLPASSPHPPSIPGSLEPP